MIKNGVLKIDDVILIWKRPADTSTVGVVDRIKYPKVHLLTIKRDEEEKAQGNIEIDLLTDIQLTVLSKQKTEEILSAKELKALEKLRKQTKYFEDDIFGDE